MNLRNIVILILCLTFVLAACNNQPEEIVAVPSATTIAMAETSIPEPTETETAVPTITSTSTPTPEPTMTMTPSFYDKFNISPDMYEIAESFPRIASSTSAEPLWAAIVCEIFSVPCHWAYQSYQPEYSYPHRGDIWPFYRERTVTTGTHNAYSALIDGTAEIIIVARQPSEDELKDAKAKGVNLDIRRIARDAFVFIVNVHNPVDNLSTEQIRAIYSGQITNWSEVGGLDKKINVYQRNENSGSQELMKSLVMQELPIMDAPDAMVLSGMSGPYTALSSGIPGAEGGDVDGIAYTVYYYAENMTRSDDIEFIGVDGVEPTKATITNGTYPLATEVYLVIREQESNNTVIQLRDLLLSYDPIAISAFTKSGYIFSPEMTQE
jgi:ABC-type phosphate transport system substrate-binding protein